MDVYGQRYAMFISFDAVAVSGITVEALKVSQSLKAKGINSYLDLGYDIKVDKGNFNKPYNSELEIYRNAFTLTRISDITTIPYYSPEFIDKAHAVLISEKLAVSPAEKEQVKSAVEESAQALAERIIQQWQSLHISTVIIENGTLPENIIYTKALYIAIERYGKSNNLGNYVIWRDHDLMWNSEKNIMKYGLPPYSHAIKPVKSNYISYVTLNHDLKDKLEEWCDHQVNIHVVKNTYSFDRQHDLNNIRDSLNIPLQDIVIARTTRIIPQKRIDRDVVLIHHLNHLFRKHNIDKTVWLLIAGDTKEHADHATELEQLAIHLDVMPYVKFLGPLHHNFMPMSKGKITIEDLYHSCDLVSFLTSWDYDSYGNPIGEAISSQRCYLTTSYEYYQEVYGQHGFEAPVMPISGSQGDLPDDAFINEVFLLLTNKSHMNLIAEKNFAIGKDILSNNVMDILNINPPGVDMRDNIFVSVVLPVYNESDRIDEVLTSLFNQKTQGHLITHNSYEVIIVDNNSRDESVDKINLFKEKNPTMDIHIINEKTQGVSSARKCGMDYAALRSRVRDARLGKNNKHYIVSADADCTVDPYWLHTLIEKMISDNGDLGTCNYYYNHEAFHQRPNLFREIQKTLRCRDVSFSLFGGFPDGKGFAVERGLYEKMGGIEIFYQLEKGRFVEHLSDDWDFGIKVIAFGGKPVYAKESCVEINSRRVDTIIDDVINGIAYGSDGIIIMKDVRPDVSAQKNTLTDLNDEQAKQGWEYSIKDYIPKNIILPVLLNPHILLECERVRAFFSPSVAERLYQRIHTIKREMSIIDFKPIHSYKTPAYRLYFEFRHEIFTALRNAVGEDIGFAPPLPSCFDNVAEKDFERFVWYFCEDRESGEAHNYFANGGVF
ncbi:glycosyl transferase [[Pantoea] beijingensis]|uniref:Glycosyl transferase n=2 Tax=[Pantoea] beijingensis TaxID=1324864 RepID=A0A443IA85_9GAMM|nr:glycosyltransferase [[Pantoea] beijingensis]RWR01009.1 glycosyl transferase [[Pantoea] beijingensis]